MGKERNFFTTSFGDKKGEFGARKRAPTIMCRKYSFFWLSLMLEMRAMCL
jgi:hypothetical protein